MTKVAALNSPIRYYGGKGGMKYDIIEHFPKKDLYDVYLEPFGGGASVLFALEPCSAEIYNDLEENVYSLFKVISDPALFVQFKQICDLCYVSRQLREEYEKDLKKSDLTIVQRAFRYWYVNRTSYSGSGGFSINISPRRGMSKSTSDFLSTVENLENIHQRLSRVVIEHTDAFNLIKKYDNEKVFMYLDPPYFPSTRIGGKYKCDMTTEQHKSLVDILIGCKSKIALSGYDNVEYKRLVDTGWKKIDFDWNTIDSKRSPRIKVESIYVNY
jgi:DNA adenine methylase